ncbi:MAG: energy-coupling factor transporter transmembrane component T [Spirochaetota bacterium]
MKNLEFFMNVSIGQYLERDSPVHRMTPVTKYLWLLAVIVPLSIVRSPLVVAFVACTTILLALLARVSPLFLLRGFLPVLPLVGIAAAMQVVFTWPGDRTVELVSLGPVSITVRELAAVSAMALRFLAMMLGIGLFTSVITEGDTARGVEDLFSPFARFGFPAHALALTIAVAFKFIPIITGELESVVKAQAARGGDFGRRRGGPIRKAKAYLPLLLPVTIRALERAEALADAMEARCYTSRGRSRYVEYLGGPCDILARLGSGIFFVVIMAGESLASV